MSWTNNNTFILGDAEGIKLKGADERLAAE
jgi:hypothetical protein